MGLLKWLVEKFKCKSNCRFNSGDFLEDIEFQVIIDILKREYDMNTIDLQRVHNIIKRPSKIV